MKRTLHIILAALVATVISSSFANAEDIIVPAAPDSHAQHHPSDQAKEAAKDENMTGMMHKCKEMHKDGKMCDHKMMQKCQEKMGKSDCQKMMKQAKTKEKTKAKK